MIFIRLIRGRSTLALLTGLLGLTPAGYPVSPDERAVTERVARRLLNALEPAAGLPAIEVKTAAPDRPGSIDCTVAWSPDGRLRATVTVTPRLVQDLGGDADPLAFLIAREIGHVVLDHLRGRAAGFDREQELAADYFGTELMLRAGFSYRRAAPALAAILPP